MGRHNLDLHDGRGIHAWRCLSYKGTGHGGRCTYVDCNFTEMKMHYMKHHAEELECIQVKWKKGYYAVEDGHIVPGAPFYPSEHPFSAVDDPDFPARRLEIDEERYQQTERGATPFDPMVRPTSASAMYRMEARRWEGETPPPRKRTRTPSPPRTRRNSREESRRDTDRRSYGGGDNWHQGSEPGAAGGYPRDDHPRGVQPAHVRYEANTDRAKRAEAERDELAQRIQSVEAELLQSMQDVEDLWREKYSALEESHKVSLKTKAEMEQKIDLMTLHETELERQYRELSDRCRAQKDSLLLAHQSEQRAVAGRRDDGRTIQQLRRKVTSIRHEMAEWAGAETAKATETYKRKKETTEKMLAETLLSMEEAEEVKRQLDVRLKAAEQDAENYRECCETALEDLRLEKHTNKEATKVAMQAAHCQDQERLTLQKQVTEIRLEAKEAQELVQSCRLEIDHMQHQIERRDRQLTAAENEIRLVQEQSAGKQEEIDALTTSLEDLKLQWNELSGGRTSRPRTMVGSEATMARFPPVEDRETDQVEVRRTLAVAYDIRAVQRGQVVEQSRRLTFDANVLSPIVRTSPDELMTYLEKFTKARIDEIRMDLERKAFDRGVLEGMRRQQMADRDAADGIILISDSDPFSDSEPMPDSDA